MWQRAYDAGRDRGHGRGQVHFTGAGGVRPFFSDKFDITRHPKYKYLSDADPKNAFDMEKHIKRRPAIVKPDEEFDVYEIDGAELQEDADSE